MNVYFVQISTWNKYGNRFKLVGYGMLILWKPDPGNVVPGMLILWLFLPENPTLL
jgi:hypothetical protein